MSVEPQPTDKPPGVEAIAMTMRFGDFVALDNVELKVRPGTFHALLGENGAGKSTLVKCIMGYYHPTEGNVLVGGHEQAIANPKDAHALGHRRRWLVGDVLGDLDGHAISAVM